MEKINWANPPVPLSAVREVDWSRWVRENPPKNFGLPRKKKNEESYKKRRQLEYLEAY